MAKKCLKCSRRCLTTVVTKDEFIEVHLELVLAHSMVGSNQPLLEVSNRPIRKWDCGVRTFSQSRPKWLVPDDMFKSSLYKTGQQLLAKSA